MDPPVTLPPGLDAEPRSDPAAAVAASERMYRTLIEHLNVGVFMTSTDGRLLHANAATVRMAGYGSLAELLAVPVEQLYARPSDRKQFHDILARDGQVRGFETTSVRKDGSQYPVWLGAVLLRDVAGVPEFVLGTIEDISGRKEAEAELELLKSSIDTAPDGAYWFDSKGHMVYVNDAGCRALGYTRAELYGLHLSDINPKATPERWSEVWRALKEKGALTFESEHRRKDGSLFPVELSSAYFVSGGKEYCNGYAVDITERKRSEKEREALHAQLLQAQKMESIGRLAGGVAHDFNNMLTVILGHVALGLGELDPKHPLYDDLVEIRSAAERAAELTGQLLAFARRQTTAPKVLDLSASVAGMTNMLRRLIGEQVDLRWQPGGLCPVMIDPGQVSQIVANLCLNARDAIDGVGTIALATDNVTLTDARSEGYLSVGPGEYVRLVVRDDGRGIPEEIMAHLFEPFFTTKEVGRGTGLGLATVYGIVAQNGGSIDVQTRPGGGTTITVYLPRHAGEVDPASHERPAPRLEGSGATVLLVEDERAILKVEKNILQQLGYRVLAAATPGEALLLAGDRSRPIDLLISDVVMPEMNGRELAARVTALWPGLRVLYVSGYPADVIAHHGVLEAGVHFLQKPFTVEGISAKVREACAQAPRT